jgi:hypothetical protein
LPELSRTRVSARRAGEVLPSSTSMMTRQFTSCLAVAQVAVYTEYAHHFAHRSVQPAANGQPAELGPWLARERR